MQQKVAEQFDGVGWGRGSVEPALELHKLVLKRNRPGLDPVLNYFEIM